MRKSWMLAVTLAIAVSFGGPLSIFGIARAHEGYNHDEAAKQSTSAETAKAKKYVCPMHEDVQSDKPGQCPKCGMTLKKMAQEEASEGDSHEGHTHEHHQ